MLQRLQTTLKKGLLLSFLALGLPQVGKADSLQVKKDVFLIDVSRSMQGHGSVSTPNGAVSEAALESFQVSRDISDEKKRVTEKGVDRAVVATIRNYCCPINLLSYEERFIGQQ